MNTDAIRENLKRGTIDLLLLFLLQNSDKYGYQLKNELYDRSLNKYELKEASMYPSLYRLVDNGYLTDNEVKVGKRRKRIYYHITEKGIQYLHALTQEYFMMTEAIQHVLLYNEESEDLNNVDAERDETLH